MSLDPVKDLADGIEKMGQISLSRPNTPIDVNHNEETSFPFLALPSELISHIFSFLTIADRMRARVNRRLNDIELEAKHFVEALCISGQSLHSQLPRLFADHHRIIFYYEKAYTSDCIRRIAQNTSIGVLVLKLSASSEFHREICNFIKYFDIDTLHVNIKNNELERGLMKGSFFIDLATSCETMHMKNLFGNTTAIDLHDLYKVMMTGSTKLRIFFTEIDKYQCMCFLDRIGIAYRDGEFFSDRDIEVYELVAGFLFHTHRYFYIFDGNLEIVLNDTIFNNNFEKGKFEFKWHEDQESLEESKAEEELVRIYVGAM